MAQIKRDGIFCSQPLAVFGILDRSPGAYWGIGRPICL